MELIGISLGNVCASAIWGVENKFRKTKEEGYKTCPFDLMISNYKGVIQCIYDDFSDFCNPCHLSLIDGNLYNTKYNFSFNHESPEHADLYIKENWPEGKMHYINNNYQHFIERYERRINAFRNYLHDPNNYVVFIVQFFYDTNPQDDCIELKQALNKKYPLLKYEIKVID